MATTKTVKEEVSEKQEISEIELLKKQIEELTKLVTGSQKKEVVKEEKEETERKIQQDEYIPVMSLLPYSLNLSTKPGGQGTTKHFETFGEVKRVMYRDLVDMIENHKNFLESGYFYILDTDVVRQNGLDDLYSKIFTKEKIEQILENSSEEGVAIYELAGEGQKEIIIQLLIDRVRNNPDSINLNLVDKISRVSNINILEKAEDSRKLEKYLEEEASGKKAR